MSLVKDSRNLKNKKQVKTTINQLIEDDKMSEDKDIFTQYKALVPKDLETVFLESKI